MSLKKTQQGYLQKQVSLIKQRPRAKRPLYFLHSALQVTSSQRPRFTEIWISHPSAMVTSLPVIRNTKKEKRKKKGERDLIVGLLQYSQYRMTRELGTY